MASETKKLIALGVEHKLQKMTGGASSWWGVTPPKAPPPIPPAAAPASPWWGVKPPKAAAPIPPAAAPKSYITKTASDIWESLKKNATKEKVLHLLKSAYSPVTVAIAIASMLVIGGLYMTTKKIATLNQELATTKDKLEREKILSEIKRLKPAAAAELEDYLEKNRKPMVSASLKLAADAILDGSRSRGRVF